MTQSDIVTRLGALAQKWGAAEGSQEGRLAIADEAAAEITALREQVEGLRKEHDAARQNFHTMQLAANELRIRAETSEARVNALTEALERKPDLALIEATARKINPGRSEDHIKSVALDALSIYRALQSSAQPLAGREDT